MSQYKFYITIPLLGEVEVQPCNESLTWKKSRYKKECFFREELDTELVFDKDNYFAEFWKAEKDECRCNVWDIRIEEKCCEDDYQEVFTGTLNFVDGKWNPELCQVAIKPRLVDAYTCMLRTWKNEKNFLQITDRVNVKTIVGEIQCITLNSQDNPPNPPNGYGYTLTFFEEDTQYDINDEEEFIQYRARYCRQCLTTDPNDPFWQNEDGLWYAPIPVAAGVRSLSFSQSQQIRTTRYEIIEFEADNGITLQNFLEFYLSDCFPCIISNFFNINPDGTAPNNTAYQRAAIDYANVVVFQTSDIVNSEDPNAFAVDVEDAAGTISWKDIWEDLKLLNLCMVFDNGCLRIEHVSYFSSNKLLNLRGNEKTKDCLVGTGNYTIDPIDIPRFERLTYQFKTIGKDFNEGYIEYDETCSDPDEDRNNNEIDFIFKNQLNDIVNIYNNDDYESNESVLDNITLVATSSNGIVSRIAPISGQNLVNAPFASSYIIEHYWLWDRPQCRGNLNGQGVRDFFTTKPTRKLPDIELLIKCQVYRDIDPSQVRVRTLFSDAVIEEITYSVPSERLVIGSKF